MRIKRFICAILAVGLVLSGLNCENLMVAQAADSGRNLKNAKTLNVDIVATGKITDSKAIVYKFTAPANGYVSFGIERKKVENTVEPVWNIMVLDAAGSAVSEDHGSTFTTQPLMMKLDDICYILVEEFSHADDEEFLLSAVFTENYNVIAEPCDKIEEATYSDASQTFIGVIDADRDKDYMKITSHEKGYVRIDFKKYKSTSTLSPAWKLNFFDSDLNALFTLRSEYVADSMNTEGLYFALPEDGTIYIEIANAHNSTGVMYTVTTRFTETSQVEKEPNNSYSRANTIKLNSALKGSLAESKTGDYYKFKASSNGKFVVNLTLSNEVPKGYKITVLDSKKDQITSKRDITDKGKLSFKGKKGKTYYVLIEHTSLYKSSYNALYKIKMTKKK